MNTGVILVFSVLLAGSLASSQNFLHLDGSNDEVRLGSLIPVGASYTKEAWVWLSGGGGRNILGSYGNPLWVEQGGRLASGHVSYHSVVDAERFPTGLWTHVAVTYDAPVSELRLYRNGRVVAVAGGVAPYSGGAMVIGNHFAGANGWRWRGMIDDLRIWNVARSPSEIEANMNTSLSSGAGLVASFDFEQGLCGMPNPGVTTLIDATASGNHGTMVGFSLNGCASNWVCPSAPCHMPASGTTCGTYSAYGSPTPGPGASVAISGSGCSRAGQTVVIDLVAQPSSIAFLCVGFAQTASPMFGVVLLQSTDFSYLVITGPGGQGSMPLALPPTAMLVDQHLYLQGVALDVGSASLSASSGLDMFVR